MRLYQYKDGFRYTSDTMFLYDFIASFGIDGAVLDVGAGCGVLGLLLARDFKISLTSIEILPPMYELVTKNATQNNINCEIINGDFLSSNLEGFDFIVSNPPFYSDSLIKSSCNKLKSARYSESMPLEPFLSTAKKKLKANGELFFCFDAKRIAEIFEEFSKQRGFKIVAIKFVHAKKDKNSKLVLIRAKKNSKASLEILPPLFAFEGENYSDEAQKIYSKASTQSITI
jgi:tRNA1(Val) A37 N6-methylase TrmN6